MNATPTADPAAIKLRYLDLPNAGDVLLSATLAPAKNEDLKRGALGNLGITPEEGEKPLHAWLRAMAEENDLPHQIPAIEPLRDAIAFSAKALRFAFFLA